MMELEPKATWRQWLFPGLLTVFIIAAGYAGYLWEHRAAFNQVEPALNPASESSPVDPGTNLDGRPAPIFTLTNQRGQRVSLADYRGKVVVLAFVDSKCTTVCPLTTASMMDAVQMLSPADRKKVQLLGVDGNPDAISVQDVRTYTVEHGLQGRWNFVTGSLKQLRNVWKNYFIYTQIVHGQIDHTPALYIIDPQGNEQRVYLTPMKYDSVQAQASQIARDMLRYIPEPTTHNLPPLKYAPTPVHTNEAITLPAYTSDGPQGDVTIPSGTPHLIAFLASWQSNIRTELTQLNRLSKTPGVPTIFAVDVGSTEPSSTSLARTLKSMPSLSFPIAYDSSGSVADAFGAQDLSWVVAMNAKGKEVWHHAGWMSPSTLQRGIAAAEK